MQKKVMTVLRVLESKNKPLLRINEYELNSTALSAICQVKLEKHCKVTDIILYAWVVLSIKC